MAHATNPDALLPGQDITLLGAVRRYWWLVALVTLGFAALGYLLASSQPVTYEASASALIKDPRAAAAEAGTATNQSSERHLADQVEILRSVEVAALAAEALGEGTSTEDVLESTSVTGDLTSSLITVTYSAETSDEAKAGADAVVLAYISVMEQRARDSSTTSSEGVDALIVSVDERLVVIQTSIDDLSATSDERAELERQIAEAQQELNETRQRRDAAAAGSEERARLNARIDELLRDFEAWNALLRIESPNDDLAVLIASRDSALAERAALVAERDLLIVGANNPDSGVLLVSPAEAPDSPAGIPPELILIGFVLLGLAMGGAIAYGLSVRKTAVSDAQEPEALLGVPLIVDVPAGTTTDRTAPIPVLQAPETQRAEAFRFISAAIRSQQQRAMSAGHAPARVLAFVSPNENELRASSSANTAVAMAEEGHRVLVVDADLKDQTVTSMLMRNSQPMVGIVDVIEKGVDIDEAVLPLDGVAGVPGGLSARGSIGLLSRGADTASSTFITNQSAYVDLIHDLADKFDLVIIDCPPLLNVAYATPVLDTADASLAIIQHGQELSDLKAFSNQLTGSGTPIVGYVYDRGRGRALIY